MFHVFRVLPPDFSRNFSKSQTFNFSKIQDLYTERKLYTTTHTSLRSSQSQRMGELVTFPSSKAIVQGERNI